MPISSPSSRCAHSSGDSPSTSSLPAGQLEQGGLPDRLARLAHEVDATRRRGRRSPTAPGWLDDLALGGLAVVVAELVDPDVDDPALVHGLRRRSAPSAAPTRRRPPPTPGRPRAARRRTAGPRRSSGPSSSPAARWPRSRRGRSARPRGRGRPVQSSISSSSAACAEPPSGASSLEQRPALELGLGHRHAHRREQQLEHRGRVVAEPAVARRARPSSTSAGRAASAGRARAPRARRRAPPSRRGRGGSPSRGSRARADDDRLPARAAAPRRRGRRRG